MPHKSGRTNYSSTKAHPKPAAKPTPKPKPVPVSRVKIKKIVDYAPKARVKKIVDYAPDEERVTRRPVPSGKADIAALVEKTRDYASKGGPVPFPMSKAAASKPATGSAWPALRTMLKKSGKHGPLIEKVEKLMDYASKVQSGRRRKR